jgi:hypothetical protein
MAYPVTLNGRTYTLADFQGTNYVDGLPDAFEDFVTHAGDIYNDTSTSSVAIGTGSKTFTVSSAKPYQAGTPLRIADSANPETNFLDCIVTSYSGTTLVVNAFGYAGSGTIASWTINIGGAKTVDGTLAVAQGGTGATTASDARTNLDVYSKADADSRFLNVSGEASNVTMTGDVTIGDTAGDTLTVNAAATFANGVSFGDNVISGDDIDGGTISNFASTGIDDNAVSTAITIDSSQDVTFTSDAKFPDNGKAIFGAGSDLEIYHNATDSVIADVGTGNLKILANDLRINNADSSKSYITGVNGSYVNLYYNGSPKLETTSTGIDVTGSVTADGLTVNSGVENLVATFQSTDTEAQIALVDTTGTSTIRARNDFRFHVNNASTPALKIDSNNDISFYEDTGTTQALFWDASAESLGLGTTSPDGKLNVFSASAGTVTADADADELVLENSGNVGLSLLTASTGESGIYFGNPGTNGQKDFYLKYYHESHATTANRRAFTFNTASTERMRIDSSGNVLVGRTDAATANNVAGIYLFPEGGLGAQRDSNPSLFINRFGTDGDIAVFRKQGTTVGSIGVATSELYLSSGNTGLYFDDVNNLIRPTNSTGGLRDNTVDLGKSDSRFKDLHLSGTAYVGTSIGLGTSSPSSYGGGFVVDDLGINIVAGSSGAPGTNKLSWWSDNNGISQNAYISVVNDGATTNTGEMVFYTKNASATLAERMRISASGNLLVGTTSYGSVGTTGSQIGGTGTGIFRSTTDIPMYLNRVAANTGYYAVLSVFREDVQSGYIGATQGGTPSFAAPSDIRLKENITDHESELSNVMALRPVRWDWKDKDRGAGEGFVAQELEQTAWADLVSEGEDGYKVVSGLGAVETRLIKALQEQQAMIETLQAQVAELQGA